MVDVQPGDGLILETPPDAHHERQVGFIDGGENQLFARHVAARFRHRKTSAAHPTKVALTLVVALGHLPTGRFGAASLSPRGWRPYLSARGAALARFTAPGRIRIPSAAASRSPCAWLDGADSREPQQETVTAHSSRRGAMSERVPFYVPGT